MSRIALPVTTLAAGALLLATTAPADAAAPVRGGTASSGENVVRGAGSGTASADVDPTTGAIDLRSTARGGQNLLSPLGIALLGGPTSAGSSGTVSQRLGVFGEGTYEVRVTFAGATSTSTTAGSGSTSELRSVFAGIDCGEDCSAFTGVPSSLEPAGVFEQMPDAPTTVTSTVVVTVPEGESAALFATVGVSATASAYRTGNSSESTAAVSSISTEVVSR